MQGLTIELRDSIRNDTIAALNTQATHDYFVAKDVIDYLTMAPRFSSIDFNGFMMGHKKIGYSIKQVDLMERTYTLLQDPLNWPEFVDGERLEKLKQRIEEVRTEQKVVKS